MAISITETLDILRAHGIEPDEGNENVDLPGGAGPLYPEIGEIREGEAVYATSLGEVLGEEEPESEGRFGDDDRLGPWREEIRRIIDAGREGRHQGGDLRGCAEPPEPHCAWYCPIHFYGHGWGIYIRESCVLSSATDIAGFVDWTRVTAPFGSVMRQLLRSAFYVFFLHEQFHHKVESLGFRFLIATRTDRYRPYKANVYRPALHTPACIEEALANADSYRRLDEPRYTQRVDKEIRVGLREFLKASFALQPPGYADALRFLAGDKYKAGLYELHSKVLDGVPTPTTPTREWSLAPNLITSLCDITDEIYVVLPAGARPIFRPTSVDPGVTVSTAALVRALEKHYGYLVVPGGKGSHVKLSKTGSEAITLPGNRPVLSPGVVKQVLNKIGGHPISRLPDVLAGRLAATT